MFRVTPPVTIRRIGRLVIYYPHAIGFWRYFAHTHGSACEMCRNKNNSCVAVGRPGRSAAAREVSRPAHTSLARRHTPHATRHTGHTHAHAWHTRSLSTSTPGRPVDLARDTRVPSILQTENGRRTSRGVSHFTGSRASRFHFQRCHSHSRVHAVSRL